MHFSTLVGWFFCVFLSILYSHCLSINAESWLVPSRFLWRPWASCRASFRMLACTQTRRLSIPCQHSLTCPNTPSSSSSRISVTMSNTMDASRSWVRGQLPAEAWTSVSTEKRSCFQAQRTQSRVRTEPRRSSSPQRGVVGVQGDKTRLQSPPLAPTPASHPQGPMLLRTKERTRDTAGLGALWPTRALHPVLESRLSTQGRDRHTEERTEEYKIRSKIML